MGIGRIAGRVEVSVNGVGADFESNLKVDLGIPRREPQLNGKGDVVGFKEVYEAPSLEGTIKKSSNASVSNLGNMVDATITAVCGDGTRFLLESAWTAEGGIIEMGDGNIPIKICARAATEIN